MARIKFGSLVSEVSGSIGSATFQKSLYGNTLRNKPHPRRSASPAQLGMRVIMSILHQAWRALTPAQRASWNQFISYSGATINRDRNVLLTGHALFLKYNFLRLICKFAIVQNLVYSPLLPWPALNGFEGTGGDFKILFSASPQINNHWFVLKLSAPRLPSLSFSPAGLRFMFVTYAEEEFYLLNTSYIAAFGTTPLVGDTIHYELQWFDYTTPVISQKIKGTAVIAAI